MRLDPQIIARAPVVRNPLGDREVRLRGLHTEAIENLGVLKDHAETLDLSDNNIKELSNFPRMRNLRHLVVSQNPVEAVTADLVLYVPHLRTLVLSGSALEPAALAQTATILGQLHHLEWLSLKDAPIQAAPYYREYLIHKCKHLRVLDYERVRPREREEARRLFQNEDGSPSELAVQLELNRVDKGPTAPRKLTPEDAEHIRGLIEAATSVDEIRRLSRMLAQNYVPSAKEVR